MPSAPIRLSLNGTAHTPTTRASIVFSTSCALLKSSGVPAVSLGMSTPRPMTKSPLAVARTALAVAEASLPRYSSTRSRKDYTQHQLFAALALRQFFKTDYRGIAALLGDSADLRDALGLTKVPHFSTLAYAADRLLKRGASTPSRRPCSPTPKPRG